MGFFLIQSSSSYLCYTLQICILTYLYSHVPGVHSMHSSCLDIQKGSWAYNTLVQLWSYLPGPCIQYCKTQLWLFSYLEKCSLSFSNAPEWGTSWLSDSFPDLEKPIQERKMKANWKRGIWSESSIKKLTTAWRRIEEITCFVDVTDQKLFILNGLCTAKCSQGEHFSSLSLSKLEWMGHSPANIAGIKMGFSCPDQPNTFLICGSRKN